MAVLLQHTLLSLQLSINFSADAVVTSTANVDLAPVEHKDAVAVLDKATEELSATKAVKHMTLIKA